MQITEEPPQRRLTVAEYATLDSFYGNIRFDVRVRSETKIPLYVRAGVPSWIVGISLRRVEFYASEVDLQPERGRVFTERDSIEVLGVRVAVCDLF